MAHRSQIGLTTYTFRSAATYSSFHLDAPAEVPQIARNLALDSGISVALSSGITPPVLQALAAISSKRPTGAASDRPRPDVPTHGEAHRYSVGL